MILMSRLYPAAIATDKRVIAFAQKEAAAEELQQLLLREQKQYWAAELVKSFDYRKIVDAMEAFQELVPGKKLPDINAALALSQTLRQKAMAQSAVAEKFQAQLQQLLQQVAGTGNSSLLEERVNKGIGYFVKTAAEEILQPLQEHIASLQHASKVKKYCTALSYLESIVHQQLQKLIHTRYEDISFCKDPAIYEQYIAGKPVAEAGKKVKKTVNVKGSSQAESLDLFKKGNSIPAIAAMRQLSESTVGGHLAMFVRSGKLSVLELLTEQQLKTILPVVIEAGGNAVSPIKEILGDSFTYTDIRFVLNHWQRLQEENVNA